MWPALQILRGFFFPRRSYLQYELLSVKGREQKWLRSNNEGAFHILSRSQVHYGVSSEPITSVSRGLLWEWYMWRSCRSSKHFESNRYDGPLQLLGFELLRGQVRLNLVTELRLGKNHESVKIFIIWKSFDQDDFSHFVVPTIQLHTLYLLWNTNLKN